MNIVKKLLLLGVASAILSGCSGFVPRQDIYEKVEFANEGIEEGMNEITLYSLEYPSEYKEKIKFLNEFEISSKKLILQDKKLNLLITRELYNSLDKFKNGEFLKEEELYIKLASDLDEFEKNELNRSIKVEVTDRGGEIQSQLNKQLAFWYEALKRRDEFDGNKIYTELDKQRLMEEVRGSRKEFFEVLNTVNVNLVIKVENPYDINGNDNGYWETKDIDLFNQSGTSREVQNIELPIYLSEIEEEQISKIVQSRGDFKTPVLILESKNLTGYTIEGNKYTFYRGGDTLRGYYKGYDLRIEVKEIEVEEIPLQEEGIITTGILKRKRVEAKGLEEKVETKKKKSVDWGLN